MTIQVAISLTDVIIYTKVLVELQYSFTKAEVLDNDEFVMFTVEYNFPHELHTLGYFFGKYKTNLDKGC